MADQQIFIYFLSTIGACSIFKYFFDMIFKKESIRDLHAQAGWVEAKRWSDLYHESENKLIEALQNEFK